MLQRIIDIVKEAGELIRGVSRGCAKEEKGSPANLVTEYDRAVQAFLIKELGKAFPHARFMGEEEEEHHFYAEGQQFIIDPIDGTTNFAYGFGMSAISVALLENGVAEYGVVYNPYTNETFSARRGGGAFLNGEPITVSDRSLPEGVLIFGSSPYDTELRTLTFTLVRRLADKMADIRRLGSAALDLCHLAAGRADAFFEASLRPWDYAAGALILTEAGGKVTDREGKPLPYDRSSFVVGGTGATYDAVFQTVTE